MGEKAKKIAAAAKQRWKSTSRKIKTLLGAGVVTVVVVLAILFAVVSNQPYATLFSGLSQTDMSAILAYLSDNGITQYKVEDDTILVPESQEAALKAQVLQAGYPSSGYSYDTYFDHAGSLTTEPERNQVTLYALQDRMQAVICNFDGVKDAAVFLTPGEDHTYVLDSSNKVEATATVTVTMEDGKTLTDNQVKAIRNLVSNGLAGLNVENVSIEDTYGNPYTVADGFDDLQDTSELKLKLEEQWNNNIRTRVMQTLLPLYGEGNVQVGVNTVVDVDRTYTDSTDYTQEENAEGNDDSIIGSQIWENQVIRGEDNATGGVAGTQSNADLNTYVTEQMQPDGTEQVLSSSGQNDYLVDTQKQQVERTAGYIRDVMVSVTINEKVAGSTNTADLYDHVGRAAGISQADQAEKISILVAPFYQPTEDNAPIAAAGDLPGWAVYAAIGGGVLFLVLLAVILIVHRIRAKKRRKLAQEEAMATGALQAAPVVEAKPDIMEMQTEKSLELRQDVRKFAEENPEIAAQMVKNWLREGEGAK